MLDFLPTRISTRVNKALNFDSHPIGAALRLTIVVSVIFFFTSSLKHAVFLSSAWDMGIFDQAVYLISQGLAPISSYMGFHVLGDHAALILYPLALLYKIHVSTHWLFLTQAIALASGIIPTWKLAQHAGLTVSQSKWVVLTYLLYPVLFSANQFHFHPEVFAIPAFLWAIWAAQTRKIWLFCAAIALILSCKAVLSLTVFSMGIWLWKFEHRRKYGLIAIVVGLAWFVISTQMIIPFLGGNSAEIQRHLYRYGSLGNSFSEIAIKAVTQPWLVIEQVVSRANIVYLLRLTAPIVWALSPQSIAPLVGAIPCVFLNLLSDSSAQKSLAYQYSLPVLPFVVMTVIAAFKLDRGWVRKKRIVLLCLITGFILLSAVIKSGDYLRVIDNWQAKREAVALVPPSASVLTVMDIAPHLSHRSKITTATVAFDASKALDFSTIPNYEAVLLDVRHTNDFTAPQEFLNQVLQTVQTDDRFNLKYQRDDVYLFLRKF
ncbi:DUF2079 domain-containing protein [Leptolyngbya sp. NIES-2104]|uniref:DUF2079 domain-containing protein n=1 Tax=Leptolyngbya sp. NIES-2104 TaxID=1552121 RepID=UPI0006EC97A8|nr:DUF2079 domain-containing protein [Leptolyngbya sp. NIES-2104]GAP95082.1 membrane protein [Leptolyngbya sp. NIES-2104]